MASNEVNMAVGKVSGMFFHAPLTAETTFPAYPGDTLGSEWKEVGFISEEGPTLTPFGSTEKIKAWSKEIVRQFQSEQGKVKATIISTTEESLKTVFGDAVSTTPASTDHGKLVEADFSKGPTSTREAFLFVSEDGDDSMMLLCESGIVSEIEDVPFTPSEALAWGITIEGDWKFVKDDGQKA